MHKIFNKISSLILVIGFVFAFSFNTAEAAEYSDVTIDGEISKVRAADIYLNGNKVATDTPAFTYKSRTLAPLRAIGEALGAEVSWDEADMIATLSLNNKVLSMKIDSNKAVVDGVEKNISYDMPAKLVNKRTMIPLRFIAEELDCKVVWDDANYLVRLYSGYKNIYVDGKLEALQIVNTTLNGNAMNLDFPSLIYNQRTLLPVRKLAEALSAEVEWDDSGVVTVKKDGNTVVMNLDSTEYTINGETKTIPYGISPKLVGDRTMVPMRFLGESILGCAVEWDENSFTANINTSKKYEPEPEPTPEPELAPEPEPAPEPEVSNNNIAAYNGIKIVLDAGHGGSDPGALSYSLKNDGAYPYNEKTVTLNVTKKLQQILSDRGYSVIMTRDSDYFVGLTERAEIANNNGANAFVSIHFNSAGATSATGLETFYFPGSGEGRRLADNVQKKLIERTGAVNRGLKEARFTVIAKSNCPAILTELGFVSNPNDEYLLQSDEYHNTTALAIADGIDAYFGR